MERFRLLGMYVIVVVIVLICTAARVATSRTPHRPSPHHIGAREGATEVAR